MLTNPNWNLHTNYAVNDIFKPDAASQLVSTIPYDYVITQDMLDWGDRNAKDSNGIDIAKVLKKGDTGSTAGITPKKRISVMLDCDTDSTMTLNFRNLVGSPWFAEGMGTNTLDIYPKAPFVFTGRSGPTYIHSGYKNFVALPDTIQQATLYVGVFTCNSNIPWSTGAFIYEAVQGNNVPSGASVVHTAWMTNKVPVSVSDITDLSELNPESFVLHTGNIYPSEVDNTSFTAAQEILGKNLLPYLVLSYDKGYSCFLPLVRIEQGCILVFRREDYRREDQKQDYRLVQGTGNYNADTNPNGNNIPVGSRGWLIVNAPVVPEVIDFPGASTVQADVYAMLKRNLSEHGLPKLKYQPPGSQAYLISYAYYIKLSSNEYNFYWAYTSGGTTTTLWMNETGTWAIS